jgi:hypothetical protein
MTAEGDALERQCGKLFAAISQVLFEADPIAPAEPATGGTDDARQQQTRLSESRS